MEGTKVTGEACQYTMIFNLALRFLMSTSLGMLYTMVNALQLLTTLGLVSQKMPANALQALSDLQSLAGFEVIPPDGIIAFLFPNISETSAANESFHEMK